MKTSDVAITIKNISCTFKIQCPYAWDCYKKTIIKLGESLFDILNKHKEIFNVEKVLKNFLQMIVELIDEESTCYFNENVKLDLGDLKLEEKNDLADFEKFFSKLDEIIKETVEKNNIFKNFENTDLQKLIEKLIKQFENYASEVIENIVSDYENKKKIFVELNSNDKENNNFDDEYNTDENIIYISEESPLINKQDNIFAEKIIEDIKIEGIKNLGSDRHNSGKQVLLLEFKNGKKFIYKPTDLTMDDFFLGELDINFKNKKSVVQMINEFLVKKKNKIFLPTYKIYPSYDDKLNGYGYIEYLPHEPSFKNYFKEKINNEKSDIKYAEFLTFISREGVKNIKTLKAIGVIEFYYKYLMRRIASNWSKDNVCNEKAKENFIVNEEELKECSCQAGMWFALAKIFGLDDVHCENIIVSNKKFFVIDLESCLSNFKIEDNFFAENTGSFSSESKGKIKFYFLGGGAEAMEFEITDKNILYSIKKDKLFKNKLDKESFIAGVNLIFDIVGDNKEEFKSFLKDDFIKRNAFIRRLIFSTKSLNVKVGKVEDFLESNSEMKKIYLEESGNKFYREFCVNKCFEEQILSLNVPIFYVTPDGKYIFDVEKNIIEHPLAYNKLKILKNEEELPNSPDLKTIYIISSKEENNIIFYKKDVKDKIQKTLKLEEIKFEEESEIKFDEKSKEYFDYKIKNLERVDKISSKLGLPTNWYAEKSSIEITIEKIDNISKLKEETIQNVSNEKIFNKSEENLVKDKVDSNTNISNNTNSNQDDNNDDTLCRCTIF